MNKIGSTTVSISADSAADVPSTRGTGTSAEAPSFNSLLHGNSAAIAADEASAANADSSKGGAETKTMPPGGEAEAPADSVADDKMTPVAKGPNPLGHDNQDDDGDAVSDLEPVLPIGAEFLAVPPLVTEKSSTPRTPAAVAPQAVDGSPLPPESVTAAAGPVLTAGGVTDASSVTVKPSVASLNPTDIQGLSLSRPTLPVTAAQLQIQTAAKEPFAALPAAPLITDLPTAAESGATLASPPSGLQGLSTVLPSIAGSGTVPASPPLVNQGLMTAATSTISVTSGLVSGGASLQSTTPGVVQFLQMPAQDPALPANAEILTFPFSATGTVAKDSMLVNAGLPAVNSLGLAAVNSPATNVLAAPFANIELALTEAGVAQLIPRDKAIESPAITPAAPAAPGAVTPLTAQPVAHLINGSTPPLQPVAPDIPMDVRQPGWGNNLGQHLMWMANNQIQQAEIKINPEHLGPLEIHLSLHQEQASVTFFSHDNAVRQAIENSLPRLRDMLDNQGVRLSQAQVADQSWSRQQHEPGGQQSSGYSSGYRQTLNSTAGTAEIDSLPSRRVALGIVDHYV